MNPDQMTQRLSWLDEEHRKDKTMMADLVGQLDQLRTQITGLSRGLQDLEERWARVQSQSLRYSQIEQALGQVKTEVTLLFEQFNQRVQQREEEAFKIRQKERERLDRAVMEMGDRIDEVARQIPPFASDHDAIKRVENGQIPLVRGLEELSKRQEATNARIAVTEEWVKRTGALIAEIQQLSERLRQDRADALEAMRRADQMRARQITEWNEQMKVMQREMQEWVAKIQPMLDLPKEVRTSLSGLVDLKSELTQIEPRLVQRQKLTDEFARTEIAAMKVELEKRLTQHQKEWEFMREEWPKKITLVAQRIDPLEEWRPTIGEQFHEIREKMDVDRQRWLDVLVDVVRMMVEYERALNARYEPFAGELLKRVEMEQAGVKVKKPPKTTPES